MVCGEVIVTDFFFISIEMAAFTSECKLILALYKPILFSEFFKVI